MMTENSDTIYTESYEYHGNTAIEHIRRHNGVTVLRDWILFDSVEDAEMFFIDCSSQSIPLMQ